MAVLDAARISAGIPQQDSAFVFWLTRHRPRLLEAKDTQSSSHAVAKISMISMPEMAWTVSGSLLPTRWRLSSAPNHAPGTRRYRLSLEVR